MYTRDNIAEIEEAAGIRQTGLLDAIDNAAVLINASGEVVHSNRAAIRLFDDEILVRDRKLVATDQRSNHVLQRLIHMATEVGASPTLPFTILLTRRDRRPLLATLLHIQNRAKVPGFGFAIVLITDPNSRPKPDEAVLRGAFGLTPAEVYVAYHLIIRGHSVDDVAHNLRVTRPIVRKLLTSIFAKTKTRRRKELVRLLLDLRPRDKSR